VRPVFSTGHSRVECAQVRDAIYQLRTLSPTCQLVSALSFGHPLERVAAARDRSYATTRKALDLDRGGEARYVGRQVLLVGQAE
jgi:hypothetical protein